MKIKYAILIIITLGGVIILDTVKFEEGKYLFVMFFGFMANNSWGENKPHEWVNSTWRFCKVFLFSLIGASIILKTLKAEIILKSVATIVFGLVFRSMSLLIIPTKRFNLKERIFMVIGKNFFNFLKTSFKIFF